MKTHTTFLLMLCVVTSLSATPQPTITPAFAVGTYQHFLHEDHKLTGGISITAGYMLPKKDNVTKAIAELTTLIPLDNNHPLSFSLNAGIYLPVTNKFSLLASAGPEIHLQQLYKYPLDGKDAPNYPTRKRMQFNGKVRLMHQFQDDDVVKLLTEFSFEQMMPLIKFGMFIIIKKKSYE